MILVYEINATLCARAITDNHFIAAIWKQESEKRDLEWQHGTPFESRGP
jgi:hypothetical protein